MIGSERGVHVEWEGSEWVEREEIVGSEKAVSGK